MKRLLWIMLTALLFLSACNQVESFEGEADISEGVLNAGCAEAIDLAEDIGVQCEVQLNDEASIVDETGKQIPLEELEEKEVRVVLDGSERIWNTSIGTQVTAEKIVVLDR